MGTHVHMYLYTHMHACIQIPHTHSHTREWINMSSALCHTMDIIDRLLLHVSWWKEVFYRRSRRSEWTVSYRLSNLHLPWWSAFKISLGFQVFKDDLTFSYSFFLLFCLFVLFLSFIYFCFMCMGVFTCTCICEPHVCIACGGKKRAMGSPWNWRPRCCQLEIQPSCSTLSLQARRPPRFLVIPFNWLIT